MKPLAKSQLNYSEFVSFILLYGILFSIIRVGFDDYYISLLSLIVLIILLYVPIFLFVNKYYFYEDFFAVVYLFRFKQKKKVYAYSDVLVAKYMNMGGKGNRAWIVLIFKGKNNISPKVLFSSFSFTHYKLKKRKELLLLLKQKEVPIEVKSIFKKDKELLK